MAIDDNTVYGLTGAQVKELPEKINELRGMTKVLTADDYNANYNNWSDTDPANFNAIAVWKLEPGIYTVKSDNDNSVLVYVRADVYSSGAASGQDLFIVGKEGSYGIPILRLKGGWSDGQAGTIQVVASLSGFASDVFELAPPRNNLTSTTSARSLSARQGKVLNDKIGGNLSDLTTTDKTSLINAINELASRVAALEGN